MIWTFLLMNSTSTKFNIQYESVPIHSAIVLVKPTLFRQRGLKIYTFYLTESMIDWNDFNSTKLICRLCNLIYKTHACRIIKKIHATINHFNLSFLSRSFYMLIINFVFGLCVFIYAFFLFRLSSISFYSNHFHRHVDIVLLLKCCGFQWIYVCIRFDDIGCNYTGCEWNQ